MTNLIKDVQYNGYKVTLELATLEQAILKVNNYFDEMLNYIEEYGLEVYPIYPLYSVNELSKKEDILKEQETIIKQLKELYLDDTKWLPILDGIGVKKNGRFKKNSISQFMVVESATNYFTEFTNAWSTLVFKLKAKSEDTVQMISDEVTFTN